MAIKDKMAGNHFSEPTKLGMENVMIEYATLKLAWWLIVGILMVGYAIMDGYDLGVAGLLTVIGKRDVDRRIMINTIAPHWDGNQVWLIALGGCLFAGWPLVYATSFSGFYFAMLLVLYSLIVRPLCLEYRVKVTEKYKKICDIGLLAGGIITPVIAGVAMGNLFQGFGFNFDNYMRSNFTSTFWSLLNPFGLMCGILSLCMIWMQGGTWLGLRAEYGPLRDQAIKYAQYLSIIVIVLFAAGGVWIAHMQGYVITQIDVNAASNPLNKSVAVQTGAWLANYHIYPLMVIAPIVGFAGALLTCLTVKHISWLAFIASSLSIAGIVATAGLSLFPFLMPSNTAPSSSLTVWDSTSSYHTLSITVVVGIVFISAIILYTTWCHWKMWRRLGVRIIENERHGMY